MLSDRFWVRVINNVDVWFKRLSTVREAVYRNAIDANRADQGYWIDRYERMCRITRDKQTAAPPEETLEVPTPKKKKGG